MQKLIPGQNISIPTTQLQIIVTNGKSADVSSFRLYQDEKTKTGDDFVFYGQMQNLDNTISCKIENNETKTTFFVDLPRIKNDVLKISLCITSDFPNLADLEFIKMHVKQNNHMNNNMLLMCEVDLKQNIDLQPYSEGSLILAEIYKHNGNWKFRFIDQGFNGGLETLANFYGVKVTNDDENSSTHEEITPSHVNSPLNSPTTSSTKENFSENISLSPTLQEESFEETPIIEEITPSRTNTNNSRKLEENLELKEIILTKDKNSLEIPKKQLKDGNIKIKLTWETRENLLSSYSRTEKIDLDIGAFVNFRESFSSDKIDTLSPDKIEVSDNHLGSLKAKPYVEIERSRHTGKEKNEKILTISEYHFEKIDEILIIARISSGDTIWQKVKAKITIYIPGKEKVIVSLDGTDENLKRCAIATIKNPIRDTGRNHQTKRGSIFIEYINRYYTGFSQTAKDLTWKFANVEWKASGKK